MTSILLTKVNDLLRIDSDKTDAMENIQEPMEQHGAALSLAEFPELTPFEFLQLYCRDMSHY